MRLRTAAPSARSGQDATAPARRRAARALLAAVVATGLGACYDATRRPGEREADAEPDPDTEARCEPNVACDLAGIAADYPISVGAEVVEVAGDRAVLLGEDGLPLVFGSCGLELAPTLSVARRVEVDRFRAESPGRCWVTVLSDETGPLVAASLCEGPDAGAPPLERLGLTTRLRPACEGFSDWICSTPDGPVLLLVPVTVHDLEVTADAGASATVALGETVAVGSWRARLLAASESPGLVEAACSAPASALYLVIAAREAAE